MIKRQATHRRVFSYDVARAIAIIMVVLCHSAEPILKHLGPSGRITNTILTVFFTIGRLGVPIFLFLTGALVLKKQIKNDDDVINFYKKNLLPLLIVSIIWVVIYNLFFLLSGNAEKFSLDNLLKELLFLKNVPVSNMWYMPMIIGIYIGIPFLAKIVKTFSRKSLRLAALIIFISNFIIPAINNILLMIGVDGQYLVSPVLDLSFLGGAFGLYILIGYWITQDKEIKMESRWLLFISLLSISVICLLQIISRNNSILHQYDIWYNSPLLLICSICIFIPINRINYSNLCTRIKSLVTYISKASLGIFFVHIILRKYLLDLFLPLDTFFLIKFFLIFCANIVGSALICYVLSKSKYISRYVLLIKQ